MPAARADLSQLLLRLQHEIFLASAELAIPPDRSAKPARRLEPRHVERIEQDIDRLSATFSPVDTFVLPRGGPAASELHVARTVCRRAERELWALHDHEAVSEDLLHWANRMSGLLFAMALSVNRSEGFAETPPDYSI
jgi:cob(I)alamin adenosyltransferase